LLAKPAPAKAGVVGFLDVCTIRLVAYAEVDERRFNPRAHAGRHFHLSTGCLQFSTDLTLNPDFHFRQIIAYGATTFAILYHCHSGSHLAGIQPTPVIPSKDGIQYF